MKHQIRLNQFKICVCLRMDHQLLKESFGKHITLTDEQFERVLSYARVRRYKKGQFMMHEGAALRRTHFIRSGSAIAYFIDQQGAEHVIQFAIEGWWISDIGSYIHGTQALLNVQALEDCELYEFAYEDMQTIYKEVPPIESYFLIITQNAFAAFQQRVLQNLSLDAEQRYRNFAAKYPRLILRFPQKLIASYLGMSAEFLSKVKKRVG